MSVQLYEFFLFQAIKCELSNEARSPFVDAVILLSSILTVSAFLAIFVQTIPAAYFHSRRYAPAQISCVRKAPFYETLKPFSVHESVSKTDHQEVWYFLVSLSFVQRGTAVLCTNASAVTAGPSQLSASFINQQFIVYSHRSHAY
jgi:hypothetical protein